MHRFDIPQCTIQNRNVHISVLKDALWDMGYVHFGICELGQSFIVLCDVRSGPDLYRVPDVLLYLPPLPSTVIYSPICTNLSTHPVGTNPC